jgi:pyruvate dehydrogenase E1 component beta subunit
MRELTFAEALRECIRQLMEKDNSIFVIGEDVGVYGGAFGVTAGLIEQFGAERIIDTPISEAGIAGACIGAALTGMRPIGEMQFMDFVTIAMEQLVLQAAKIRYMFGGKATVPMVMRLPGGSGTGAAAQHSGSLESWFVNVPGLKIVVPSNPYDAKGLLASAVYDNNPVIFIENKLLYKTKGDVPEQPYRVPIGQAKVVREGSHLTLIATSIMVHRAQEAAKILAEEGIEVEIIDPRSLRPLDGETIINSVKKTGKALIVHEAVKVGGFGGEILSTIVESEAFDYLEAPVRRLGGLDIPIPYNRNLEYHAVPQVEPITVEARKLARGEY